LYALLFFVLGFDGSIIAQYTPLVKGFLLFSLRNLVFFLTMVPPGFVSAKFSADIFGTVGINGRILPFPSDLQKIPHVTISKSLGWEMGNQVISVSDNRKSCPTVGHVTGQISPYYPRAAKSIAHEGVAQVRAVIPRILMAENSQSGAVRIPNNGDLLHIYVIDQGFNMRYQGSPRL
jgi:hypothetical protein